MDGEAETGAEAREAQEGSHSEFHVVYQLVCAEPSRIDAVTFTYFESFPRAEELEVQAITPNGQAAYAVEKGAPPLRLIGP